MASKQRIIFVPQFPAPLRYQEWWIWKFPEEFKKAGFDVITLGERYSVSSSSSVENACKCDAQMFSHVNRSIEFETYQINEYMSLKPLDGDLLFLSDLSFPGLFANALHHKYPANMKMFAFCHATSLNYWDYFGRVRYSKFPVECGQAMFFDKIFVGSEYHYDKLASSDFWPIGETRIVGVPNPPESIIKSVKTDKKRFLISVARPSMQKTDPIIEELVCRRYRLSEIYRKQYNSWGEYCQALSESEALLVTSKEETFGYQIVDAIINGCIPVVPNDFSYKELLPREYRYGNMDELYNILDDVKAGNLPVPKLECESRTKNFFDNIIQIMKGVRSHTI